MFYVVHVETWFQTIPENWLDKEKKIAHWPNEKNSVITMWIKKQIPRKSDWKVYSYDCLFGPFEDYNNCKNFEKQCTGYSSQDEILYEQYTKNNELSQKRHRKKNPKYEETTDSDEQSSESEDDIPIKKTKYTNNTSKLQSLPSESDFVCIDPITEKTSNMTAVPRSKQLTSTSDNVIDNKTSKCINSVTKKACNKNNTIDKDDDFYLEKQTVVLPTSDVHTNNQPAIFISLTDRDILDTGNITFDMNNDDNNRNNIPNVCEAGPSTSRRVMETSNTTKTVNNKFNVLGCMNNCCSCIGKINRKLDMILHILKSTDINKQNNARQENIEFLQLQTKEELEALEKSLVDDAEKQEQLKIVIKQEGGKNAGDHIRRVMKRIITDNLALQYFWSGQKNTIRFKDLLISKLILNSVASLHTSTNMKMMEDAIQSWLNHASDRKKKAEKKENHHAQL